MDGWRMARWMPWLRGRALDVLEGLADLRRRFRDGVARLVGGSAAQAVGDLVRSLLGGGTERQEPAGRRWSRPDEDRLGGSWGSDPWEERLEEERSWGTDAWGREAWEEEDAWDEDAWEGDALRTRSVAERDGSREGTPSGWRGLAGWLAAALPLALWLLSLAA